MDTFKSYVLKEPIGVVALITPWYYLLLLSLSLSLLFFNWIRCFTLIIALHLWIIILCWWRFRNYPLLMATWKVAPALAAGCAAILKPSELASVYVFVLHDCLLLSCFFVLFCSLLGFFSCYVVMCCCVQFLGHAWSSLKFAKKSGFLLACWTFSLD